MVWDERARLAATSSVPVVAYVVKGPYPESHNSLLTEHLVQSRPTQAKAVATADENE